MNQHLNQPIVTVYIANYNYAEYIKRSIDSVLLQTFKSYELIIIDDGSTDNSAEIIKEYEHKGNIFLVLQTNKGLTKTNNIALRMARGKYVMRLDADDYLDPHALEIMVSKLEKDSSLAFVFPDYYLVDKSSEIISHVRRHEFSKDVDLFDQPAHGACTMFRKDVLQSVGGYDEKFNRQDCYDIWLKISLQHNFTNINLPLFYYRQHNKNLTSNEEMLLYTRSMIKDAHVKKRGIKIPSVLAIVPIRGSYVDPRSLPFEKLGNKYLIDWTLEAVGKSKYIRTKIVSTPDPNIIDYVKEEYTNFDVDIRNKKISRINVPIKATIEKVVTSYLNRGNPVDIVLIAYIESPFRSAMYIDKAINTLLLYDLDEVIPVRPDNDVFYFHNGHGMRPLRSNNQLQLERDNLYRRVGGMQLIKWNSISASENVKIGHIVMDEKSGLFIRSEIDWSFAKFLVGEDVQS